MSRDVSDTVTILCLDGGGVRGLSSLYILRKLLRLINVAIHDGDQSYIEEAVSPTEIFDVVTGTSTGGLIALMIVKLRMSVDDCIKQYKDLSEKIFSNPHLRGTLTFGFGGVSKYRGTEFKNILTENVIIPQTKLLQIEDGKTYTMEDDRNHPNVQCTVLCRKLNPRTKRPDRQVVYLCSHRCRRRKNPGTGDYDKVNVADAARATSAAPRYFSHVVMNNQILADGGYGFTNNPSHAVYRHYSPKWDRENKTQRYINIGTGSEPEEKLSVAQYMSETGWRSKLADHLGGNFVRVLHSLKWMATESEGPADEMNFIAANSDVVKFDRFSANVGGIHKIKLDAYHRVGDLVKLTESYLEKEEVLSRLQDVANELAATHVRQKQRRMLRLESEPRSDLVDRYSPSRQATQGGQPVEQMAPDGSPMMAPAATTVHAESEPTLVDGHIVADKPLASASAAIAIADPEPCPVNGVLMSEERTLVTGRGTAIHFPSADTPSTEHHLQRQPIAPNA